MRQFWGTTCALLVAVSAVAGGAGPSAPDPADIRGWSFSKSLPDNFKDYGFQEVAAKNAHPVRSGATSLRFEVRAGDCTWRKGGWNDCKNDRERHELISQSWSGGEGWYAWSIYLPEDYPVIFPVKTALGQFHQKDGHVVWMFQNKDGGLSVDNQVPGRTVQLTPILSDRDMRGRWSDILVHARWTADSDGFFRVYVNGGTQPSYALAGATQSPGKRVYFKFGIYRSFVSRRDGPEPTQVVYYDDVVSGRTCAEAAVHFDCARITAR